MEAIIFTEGGKIGGLGHIARCSSIAQAFEERSINTQMVINAESGIKKILKGNNFKIRNWLKDRPEAFRLINKADIAIIDSYLADAGFYRKVSELARIPVYIDDNKRLNYPRGVVVNGGIHASGLRYPPQAGTRYLIGTKYAPLRSLFWNIKPRKTSSAIKRIMVTTGGNDPKELMPRLTKLLKVCYPNVKKDIIIGHTFRNVEEIKKAADKNTNLVFYPDVKKMVETMLKADVAISSGGQTLYELARLGVATISFCQSENQRLNLKWWRKAGFVESVKSSKTLEKEVIRYLEKLSSKKERARRAAIGKKLVDGQGPKRIVEGLLMYEN